MQKKLLILAVVALVLIGGVVLVREKKNNGSDSIKSYREYLEMLSSTEEPSTEDGPEITVGVTDETSPSIIEEVEPKISFSPQYITPISGSVQVWYGVPEMGIKLLLSKEVAEELVYRYHSPKEVWDGADSTTTTSLAIFSAKHFLEYKQERCAQTVCGTGIDDEVFTIIKLPGTYNNKELGFGSKFLRQFSDFYLTTGGSPQAARFGSEEEEKQFWQNIGPKMPNIPTLKDIYIELLEGKK